MKVERGKEFEGNQMARRWEDMEICGFLFYYCSPIRNSF